MLITSAKKNKIENASIIIYSGSYLKELWRTCVPLMISALSGTLMIFLNRIVLAKYDTHAMLATSTAANIFTVFQFGITSLAMIAEVFVGQFNGAKQYQQVGKPVWQMIWLSLFSGLVLIPLGLFANTFFVPAEFIKEGAPYLKWMMIFGPLFPMISALSAFFIGRGEVRTITIAAILGNILSVLLAIVFVFGIPGILFPQGAKGIAFATGIAEMIMAGSLFWLFLKPEYRQRYHTHLWRFDGALFLKCMHIGLPNALGHVLATAAWACAMYLLSKRSLDHITVISIGFCIWGLFSFITEGLQKGVTALAANSIGAKQTSALKEILVAGLGLQFSLALILAIPLVLMPELLLDLFIPLSNEASQQSTHLTDLVKLSCRWLWLAYLFDGMAWVVDGILTAVGDTKFIMLMNSIGTWLLCILPIYFFVFEMQSGPMVTLQCVTVFSVILFLSYYLRYKKQKWDNKGLVHTL